ncbi:GrpE protein 2 [Buchnera aphidicola str. Bp (Baizongia pistaciae)]|uniref:Protein GrpE 2 n=1 Tax=Buchnera aphidicola subsp. Baizongia pistaciae (strain Bp) TaxID=224915 RepID=GRPE2_BUCBP|nr:nucleotide exchange factor GrpE [Buchnera aphidicola]Q89AS0.1 RecName: Full=Protein GrpE 2; AltName: Full=HSP-70 cofactor 2 [Buchnera aphidicola str. Bp (Baizongia pistaciae)]AAO26906.1 GrpE protein 2 [Buchnera aphidicola str. Bp (Baizongia pistaciae)]
MNDIDKHKKETQTESKNDLNNTTITQNNVSDDCQNQDKINSLKQKILEIKKHISEVKLREQAEIENINKNTKNKIKIIIDTQLENFFRNLIPIIDSLKNIRKDINKYNNIKDNNMIQGIPLILKSLLTVTEKFGLKINNKKGKLFDPKLHTTIPNENCKNINEYYVSEIIQDGYTFHEKIIRKAIVKLSKDKKT